MVFGAIRSFDNMSEEAEVISQGKQGILMDTSSAFIKEIRKYTPVFPE
jgi:hypothetical protein